MKEPTINYYEQYIDFGDGDPVYYWWEDMRPTEIRELLVSVFNKGVKSELERQKRLKQLMEFPHEQD